MKHFNKLFLILAVLGFSVAAVGQASFSTTTLGAAITTTNQTLVTLASTSGMLAAGPVNQINTVLYVDKEFMWVEAVPSSTTVVVARAKGTGAAGRPANHVNGAKVYYVNGTTYSNGVFQTPASYFASGAIQSEVSGACTAGNELILPKIYLFTADFWDCKSGGQWILTGVGTQGQAGSSIGAFCTGALTSGGTDYIGNNICATTSALVKQLVPVAGTIANLYVVAGTAVTGGTNKDVLTVLKNGTATTLTCTFATGGAATTCSDTTHSASVAAGDAITFSFVTATSDAGTDISVKVGLY